jgi:hypothetical protein
MSKKTQIHPDKVKAYEATDYRLGHTDQDIVLNINKRSEPLANLLAVNGVNCGAFLTAFNPQGTIQSDEANAQGHAELASKLQELGVKAIEGSGSEGSSSEDGKKWPAEKSYFALGLALEHAKAIGIDFDQDAIVWVGPDSVPQLILLR